MAERLLVTDTTLGDARGEVARRTNADPVWRKKRLDQIVAVFEQLIGATGDGAVCIHVTGANRGCDYAVIKTAKGCPRVADVDLYEVKYGFDPRVSPAKANDACKGMQEVCAALKPKGIRVRNVTHTFAILGPKMSAPQAPEASVPGLWEAWTTTVVGSRELLTPTLAALMIDEDLVA
jgi:hypothetical protein